MKLLLRRDQRAGMLGKVIFSLTVRAEMQPAELAAIDKYKLGAVMLYQRDPKSFDATWTGVAKYLAHQALDLTITVRDLAEGKKVDCKDIMEMLSVEHQLKEAGEMLAIVMHSAMGFGGEEVIEL